MRILIEEYKYKVGKVREILEGIYEPDVESKEGMVTIPYIGYFYNAQLNDCVFILPKVLLKKDVDGQKKVFGKYKPEDIINLNEKNLDKTERDFLYEFSVLIYRAIVVYKNANPNTSIIRHSHISQIGGSRNRLNNSYLDTLLSLIQFNRDNQSFFFTIVKNIHSGYNKINWTRTISRKTAIIQDGCPIYLNPVNKKRMINFDEELLIIFFSILNYIGDTYGFSKELNCNFQLITGKRFKRYRKGFGKTRLRQIKYKYFSDKALQLWQLCYAFFNEAEQVYIKKKKKECLLTKSFHVVFEAMIDELIGDNSLPDDMNKEQKDGKIVDHLFTYNSLIGDELNLTYYIGDSKYYEIGAELDEKSIYKQFTYARNVIQWYFDEFVYKKKEPKPEVKLRDDLTEGYNIIPNFFISAKMDEHFDYGNDGLKQTDPEGNKRKKIQFKNRLFDRDTLLLFHYDINFFFILSRYARNKASQKAECKRNIRDKFHSGIKKYLWGNYEFYAMEALQIIKGKEKEYICNNFKELIGKVFSYDGKVFYLALENGYPTENEALLEKLEKSFNVTPIT